MNLIPKNSTMLFSKAKFLLNKRSPELCLGGGIILIVAGTVWACKASRKLDSIMEEHEVTREEIDCERMDAIDEINDNADGEEGSESTSNESDAQAISAIEKDYKRNCAKLTISTGATIIREYAPGVTLMIFGIGLLVNSHRILCKRNAALLAAYTALDDSFKKYRGRVVAKYGADIDEELYSGRTYEERTRTEVGEDGKKSKVKEKVPVVGETLSPYARFFDEASSEWRKSPDYNHTFLVCQQNSANDILRRKGYLFLNEVYSMLGLPESPTGAICGWILPEENDPTAEGDNYVDFGFQINHDFVNGIEKSVLLDFNCQGVIYDLI